MIAHTKSPNNLSEPSAVPLSFDAERFPILAEHVIGITPDTLRRARLDIANDVDERLERYGQLDPETVALVGGRRLPKPPLLPLPR